MVDNDCGFKGFPGFETEHMVIVECEVMGFVGWCGNSRYDYRRYLVEVCSDRNQCFSYV